MTDGRRMPSLWLLGVASGLSPFGATMAIPLLAVLVSQFRTDMGVVQFVVSAYLLGLSAAQPFTGFLCDRFGRRPVMLTGFALFVLASIAAAFTTDIGALIACRFLQAVGVSVGTVASRAVVRDTRGAAGSAEALSYIAAITGLAPILGPILGGWLGSLGGYPLVFLSTAALGAMVWVLMYRSLAETLDRATVRPRWSDWMRNYRTLLRSRTFMAYSLIFGFVQGSFFAFLAVGAAVFRDDFGIGERDFGLIWGLMAVTYVAGAIFCGRIARRVGSRVMLHGAVAVTLVAGWTLALIAVFAGLSLPGLLLPLALLMAAAGGVSPGSLAGAVNAHPEMAGTSSGLSSALGIVLGGTFTIVAGFLYHGDFTPVAWLIALSATLTALGWWAVARAERITRP
jgi:DHA1 family bicyclomycin/chloramphenicol resistance-like MFS transporter